MPLAERRRNSIQVLIRNVNGRSHKGEMATKPFVDHDCQRILITSRNRLAEDQFRSHVRQGTKAFLDLQRSEEHTSELQSLTNLVCRLLLEKKKKKKKKKNMTY